MMRCLSLLALLAVFLAPAQEARGEVVYVGGTHQQNFSLSGPVVDPDVPSGSESWQNNSTFEGWYSNRTTFIRTNGSDPTGSLHTFQGRDAPGDYALGSIATAGTGTIRFGLLIENATGAPLVSFTLSYTGEQWHDGGSGQPGGFGGMSQKLSFDYRIVDDNDVDSYINSLDSYSGVAALDFLSPTFTASDPTALDGNLATNRLARSAMVVLSTPLAPGQYLWLRWTDENDTGNDHGLAIDDLSFSAQADTSAVPEPASVSLLGIAGVCLLGWRRWRKPAVQAH